MSILTDLRAPWTQAQVSALNRYQRAGHLHPYTCGNEHDGERVLIATSDGWRCPSCDYTQAWAHVASTDPALAPFEKEEDHDRA